MANTLQELIPSFADMYEPFIAPPKNLSAYNQVFHRKREPTGKTSCKGCRYDKVNGYDYKCLKCTEDYLYWEER